MENISIEINTLRALNFLFAAWRLRERVYAKVGTDNTLVLTVKGDAGWPTNAAALVFNTGIALSAEQAEALAGEQAVVVANALNVPYHFIKDKAERADKAAGLTISSAGVEFFTYLFRLPEPEAKPTLNMILGGLGDA